MAQERFDLILQGGRVCDPSQGRDEVADLAVQGGKVARIETGLAEKAEAQQVIDVSGKLVVPGLVDLHTHCYWGGRSARGGTRPPRPAARRREAVRRPGF